MSGPLFVGVDCGTQSAKVVIYDLSGAPVAEGRQPLRAMSRPSHTVVQHPDDDIWDAITSACRQAIDSLRSAGRDPQEIAAVGVCPIRCCKAFLDKHGALVEPVMSWMDGRAYKPCIPPASDLAYVTTLSGYVAHRFTGVFTDTAANNIVGQWPIDPRSWDWLDSPESLNEFGVSRDQLFDLKMPGDVIGPLTESAAATTRLPVGVPVVHTANDKAVEVLGAGNLGPSTVVVSLGTYIAAMMHGESYHGTPKGFWTNFACVPNRYLYESAGIRRGMWTLTWFLDLFGRELVAASAAEGLTREQYLEREAAVVPAGSDGLLTVLDWLATDDAPFRKGSMLGFDARHGRGHMYRSILEAIALTMKTNVDAMCTELSTAPTEIVISGGGAASNLFMQIFADVFGVTASRSTHGGASLGAAICAAAGSGAYPDIPTAAAAMAATRQQFHPNSENGALYSRINSEVYRHVRQSTDELYSSSFPIFG